MAELDSSIFHRSMTPLVRPLRLNSGTLYVFPSAGEDIGLNLNARDNHVALTYYALLDIPDADSGISTWTGDASSDILPDTNRLNIFNIISEANNYASNTNVYSDNGSTSGDSLSSVKLAASLQNYMFNFETVLMNDPNYDYSYAATVSEHVFWKWLKETGAFRLQYATEDSDSSTHIYYNDRPVFEEEKENDVSTGYSRVVKSIGLISAMNSVSNESGMFNETYVSIPSSFGETECFFIQNPDDNYKLSHIYTGNSDIYLEGRDSESNGAAIYTGMNIPFYDYENDAQEDASICIVSVDSSSLYSNVWEKNSSDFVLKGFSNAYVTDPEITKYNESSFGSLNNTIQIQNKIDNTYSEFKRTRPDSLSLVLDFDLISNIWESKNSEKAARIANYDSISTDSSLCYTYNGSNNFNFNAVLLYYTVYDKDSTKALATNLFGILFLNGPHNTTSDSGTGTMLAFSIPSFEKRKSSGSDSVNEFGSGYAFRVNIKSSDIFDNSDAFVNDNTTSDSLYSKDFSNVIGNLNKSVSILTRQTSLISSIQTGYLNVMSLFGELKSKITVLSGQMNQLLQNRSDSIDASYISSIRQDTSILDASVINAGNVNATTLDVSVLNVSGNKQFTFDYANIGLIDSSTVRSQDVTSADFRVEDNIWHSHALANDYANLSDTSVISIINDTSFKIDSKSDIIITPDSSAAFPSAFNHTPADDTVYEIDYSKYIPPMIRYMQMLDKEIDNLTDQLINKK